MVYTYTPTYYSTLHDSITSLCKNILPFSSFKKRRGLPAAEQKLSKLQSDNLKWQQDSFHQILKLMGLQKEGILSEAEVSVFRSRLLDTLIASPLDQEQQVILRDKLLFLQELFYAKCISVDQYHSSKRPLLQRLAVQGAEIEARDVIVAKPKENEEEEEEEWSVIDLRDEKCLLNKEITKSKTKQGLGIKQIKEAASVFGFVSSIKHGQNKDEKGGGGSTDKKMPSSASAKTELGLSRENPFWNINLNEKESETRSILMSESLPLEPVKENDGGGSTAKKKPFTTLFHKEGKHGGGDSTGLDSEERVSKSAKKQWGFDGLKKWKKSNLEDETSPLPLSERSDSEAFMQTKRKLNSDGSAADDKVLGDKIKKELSRIQSELNSTDPNLQFSNDQIEAISTRLPVDKADLKKFFPKSWCDQHGDGVLDVMKQEFKDHIGEMGNLQNAAREKRDSLNRWTTFEDDENYNPNLFGSQDYSLSAKQQKFSPLVDNFAHNNYNGIGSAKKFETNPFSEDFTECKGNKLISESAIFEDQNSFWNPRHGSSFLG